MSHNARTRAESLELLNQPWRQGRRVGRNIYAQTSTTPTDNDVIIGQADSEWIAADIVTRHNLGLIHAALDDGSTDEGGA